MAAPRPLPPTPPGLLDDEDPGKWERVKQALWETNLNAPVRAVYNLMNTPYDVLMGDSGDAGQQAVADSFDAAGGITVGSAMVPKPSNALMMGIKAYHGSPHSFDKFSMDKIGTGEGAQAYGHGLYFAENEGVAKGYRDNLSTALSPELMDVIRYAGPDRARNAASMLAADVPEEKILFGLEKLGAQDPKASLEAGRAILSEAKSKAVPGSMYEVSINADPNAFLDWDKQLSEQPASVREALAAMDPDMYSPSGGDYDPSELGQITYQRLAAQKRDYGIDSGRNNLTTLGGAQAGATGDLKGFGIPGIKYLDAGSRVTPRSTFNAENAYWDSYAAHDKNPTSETKAALDTARANWDAAKSPPSQTRNYVVFDDSLIDIIKKYGIAGLLGAGGMYGMSADEAQAGAR